MGAIGSAVADRAEAFGMRVIYTRRSGSVVQDTVGSRRRVELPELLREADVVSIHCPRLLRRATSSMHPPSAR